MFVETYIVYNIYIYYIITLFVECKQGGPSKNVSNNFDHCVFFPDGKGGYIYIYILDPSYVKNCAPEDLHLGRGVETARHTSPCTPSEPPPRTLRIGGWGVVKIVKCPQAVCKLFVRCLCGDVINLCLRSIVPFRKVFDKEGKTKIEKCNHFTPEAYNSWQKVLETEGRDEIKKM